MNESSPPLYYGASLSNGSHALKILALRRDDAAWTAILQIYGVEILQATRRILGDDALAEDACQETLLQIRDRADQFKGGNLPPLQADVAARNWIMRIACNTALDMLRTRKRARHREEAAAYRDQPIEVETMQERMEQEEREKLASIVRGELAQMPEKQRRPLMLHFFGGLTYEQLAQELKCNMGAARVRVHRALAKLRERMNLLGVMFTASALYTLLECLQSSVAHAAEAVLASERLTQWQCLLTSSQSAVCNFASDPQFPLMARAGYAATVAVLCGSLAFSGVGAGKLSTSGLNQNEGLEARVSAVSTVRIAPLETTLRELPSTISGNAFRQAQGTASRSQSLSKGLLEASPSHTVAPPPVSRRAEAPSVSMVSAVAQMKLLRMMQQEINLRIETLQKELAAARKFSDNDRIIGEDRQDLNRRLEKTAFEQEEVARLICLLADEIEVGSGLSISLESGN